MAEAYLIMAVGNTFKQLRELVVCVELGRAGLKDRRFCHGWGLKISERE